VEASSLETAVTGHSLLSTSAPPLLVQAVRLEAKAGLCSLIDDNSASSNIYFKQIINIFNYVILQL